MSHSMSITSQGLAILAHELRHPLAPLRNAVEVIRRVENQEPRVHWAVGVIERQVQWLSRMVEELFDLACLDSGSVLMRKEVLEMATVVEQALEMAQPLMEQRQHTVSIELPRVPAHVEGDQARLLEVVVNLLNNAAKYTEAGGHIHLALQVTETELRVQVRDTGQGIAPELLPHIFDLFVQGERKGDPMQAGLGIGLTVVKWLVELHRGRIEVRSAGVGQGTEFRVYLPRWLPASAEITDNLPS